MKKEYLQIKQKKSVSAYQMCTISNAILKWTGIVASSIFVLDMEKGI